MDQEEIRRLVAEILSQAPGGGLSEEIPAEASGRHIHLSREDLIALTGGEQLERIRDLSQPGQFLSGLRVRLIGPRGVLDGTAVLGPVRKKTQVEVSLTDAAVLGIKPPVRLSGELAGSAAVHIQVGERIIHAPESVIIAERHFHMTPDDARRIGVQDRQRVEVRIASERPVTLEGVVVRVDPASGLALHIDFDEANAAGIPKGGVCRIRHGALWTPPEGQREQAVPVLAARKDGGVLELPREDRGPVLITEEMVLRAHRDHQNAIRTHGKTLITPQAADAMSRYEMQHIQD